ncbi:hypothetical protein [Phormidesmis priestleyi]|nr:hypothetical protein [Phormidesmis priestleyi]
MILVNEYASKNQVFRSQQLASLPIVKDHLSIVSAQKIGYSANFV